MVVEQLVKEYCLHLQLEEEMEPVECWWAVDKLPVVGGLVPVSDPVGRWT